MILGIVLAVVIGILALFLIFGGFGIRGGTESGGGGGGTGEGGGGGDAGGGSAPTSMEFRDYIVPEYQLAVR